MPLKLSKLMDRKKYLAPHQFLTPANPFESRTKFKWFPEVAVNKWKIYFDVSTVDSEGYFKSKFCAKIFPKFRSFIFFYFRRFLVRFSFIGFHFWVTGPSPRHQRLRLPLTNRDGPSDRPWRISWRSALGTRMLGPDLTEIMEILIWNERTAGSRLMRLQKKFGLTPGRRCFILR